VRHVKALTRDVTEPIPPGNRASPCVSRGRVLDDTGAVGNLLPDLTGPVALELAISGAPGPDSRYGARGGERVRGEGRNV
jgi:hypothetical protein